MVRVTQQSRDLTQHFQRKKLLAKHIPEVATELGKNLDTNMHPNTKLTVDV